MNVEEFEREVREAAHRLAGGRAPEALHIRVAAIPADRRRGGRWTFGAGPRLAASVVLVLVLAGAGILVVATRPQDSAITPGSLATAQVSPTTTASPTEPGLVTRDLDGLSLLMPADWKVVRPHVWILPTGAFAFLSNAPISDPCPTTFLTDDACWKPLGSLPADGILVSLVGSALLQRADASPAVIAGPVGQTCAAMSGERELHAQFSVFVVTACLRGPDLATNEAIFRELVLSIKRG